MDHFSNEAIFDWKSEDVMNGETIIALSYFPYFADLTQPLLPRDRMWETPVVARIDEVVVLDGLIDAKF